MFSPALTPDRALVLFDPGKVIHRGAKAQLVTVPYTLEVDVPVLRSALQPLAFDDLDDGQKTWMLERVCAYPRAPLRSNCFARVKRSRRSPGTLRFGGVPSVPQLAGRRMLWQPDGRVHARA